MEKYRWLGKRMLAIVLSMSLTLSLFTGCGLDRTSINEVQLTEQEKEQLINDVSDEILEELSNNSESKQLENMLGETLFISDNWEDYVGDVETFVYGLLVSELSYRYDVFPAYVELLDGTCVSGIAYTDYSECYVNEDETHCYFMAGILPYYGEEEIPQMDFDSGLVIHNADFEDDETSFILKYASDTFTEHCVVYNQYVKYGVDENGKIDYEKEVYEPGKCDETLGSLYSYDEERFVYDIEVGDHVLLTGSSLYSQFDYAELEKEVNEILEKQDINFATVDVESCAYFAQEAVTAYLLSLQEETFLGYSVKELVEIAEELDPTQVLRFTDEGAAVIDIQAFPEGKEELVKWLVGTCCVIVTVVSFVGSVISIECPPLSACSSALAGVAIEIFMEVVIEGEDLDNISWDKVVISAVTGAISGFMGPYISIATKSGASRFLLDTAVDSLLAGTEYTTFAWLEGASGKEMLDAFGDGLTLGFVFSAGFKGASNIIGKVAKKVAPEVEMVLLQLTPKLSKKVADFTSDASKWVKGLKKVADNSVFHSEYISRKMTDVQLARVVNKGEPELTKKAFDRLAKDNIYDVEGNIITKEKLKEIFDLASDNQVIGKVKVGDDIVEIMKKNGVIGIFFDQTKYQTVILPNGIKNNRNDNFLIATKELKDLWLKDSTLIPETLRKAIKDNGVELVDLEVETLKTMIKKRSNGWVLHENIDMKSITLVPRSVHDTVEGGISHLGGYSIAKHLKSHMAFEFFERLRNAAATSFVQAID